MHIYSSRDWLNSKSKLMKFREHPRCTMRDWQNWSRELWSCMRWLRIIRVGRNERALMLGRWGERSVRGRACKRTWCWMHHRRLLKQPLKKAIRKSLTVTPTKTIPAARSASTTWHRATSEMSRSETIGCQVRLWLKVWKRTRLDRCIRVHLSTKRGTDCSSRIMHRSTLITTHSNKSSQQTKMSLSWPRRWSLHLPSHTATLSDSRKITSHRSLIWPIAAISIQIQVPSLSPTSLTSPYKTHNS